MPEVQKSKNNSFITAIPKSSEKIPIDIIVPVHGRLDLTLKCIRAIYERTTSPFHLIVLDDTPDDKDDPDAMSPEYFRRLQKHDNSITYIHSKNPYKEGNEFFNEGLRHCKYNFVAVIMNSVTVEPEWDIIAVNFMKNNPKVGIVGFKTLLPSGVIESAGITMMGFTPIDIGRDASSYALNSMHECIAVQWAFALLRKEAVEGNLEENVYHGFVGWDDIDNSFTVRSKGWQIWYCGLGVGIHEPRSTRGKDTTEALYLNRANAETFYKKWGYWDLYQKASNSTNIQEKAKITEEIQGLAFSLRSKNREVERIVV